jgi:folate-binding protein YgfZ
MFRRGSRASNVACGKRFKEEGGGGGLIFRFLFLLCASVPLWFRCTPLRSSRNPVTNGSLKCLKNLSCALALLLRYTRYMVALALHEFHQSLNAQFADVNGMEAVGHYGDPHAEHAALRDRAGVLDLSFRSRLCLAGGDRQKFLNGQVTNNVKDLKVGEGCYAALVNAKAKLQSDLNVYVLENEILLDFEPGYGAAVAQRLEKHIIADDVQVVDVSAPYGLLSVQGPKARDAVEALSLQAVDILQSTHEPGHPLTSALSPSGGEGARRVGEGGFLIPLRPFAAVKITDPTLGEIYLINVARTGTSGFDLFVPDAALGAVADKLIGAAGNVGGRACGWQALEMGRIEARIPRFGADMDESNLAPEAGLDERAINYSKGCYIGQEVIARIRTYGQVAKMLRGLRLASDLKTLPVKGDKLFKDGKEIGYITSALASPTFGGNIALGYVRREVNQIGTLLMLRTAAGESVAKIVALPFSINPPEDEK